MFDLLFDMNSLDVRGRRLVQKSGGALREALGCLAVIAPHGWNRTGESR